MSTGIPANKDIKDMLEMLLGRDVALSSADAVSPDDRPAPTTGVYVDDSECLSAVILMDLELTAYVGAAIGLVPAAGAEAAIEDWDVPPAIHENACEVLNVLAALLCDSSAVHQRLYETYSAADQLPNDVVAWASVPGPRRDLEIDIKGYGRGRLSIVNALD